MLVGMYYYKEDITLYEPSREVKNRVGKRTFSVGVEGGLNSLTNHTRHCMTVTSSSKNGGVDGTDKELSFPQIRR